MKDPQSRSAWRGLAVFLALLTLSVAPARAADVKTQMVSFPGGAGTIKGFLAEPQGDGPHPAILVIHEWWGLTDWVKENAERFADQGYVALAVDLYGGKATDDPQVAHELMRALDEGEAVADMKGAVAYLEKLPVVAKQEKIGVIGWCMGGKYARLIAQESEAIGPTIICYGAVANQEDQLSKLKSKPVLGLFGEDDRGIPADKVKQFGEEINKLGGKAEIHVYKGAGHAFMRPGGDQYVAEAAKDAWKRIDAFLTENLKR